MDFDELSFRVDMHRTSFEKKIKERFPKATTRRREHLRKGFVLDVKDIQDDKYFPWLISEGWAQHSTRFQLAQFQPSMGEKLDQWIAEALKQTVEELRQLL